MGKTIAILAALLVGLVAGAWGATIFSTERLRLAELRDQIEKAWEGAAAQLEARADLAADLALRSPGERSLREAADDVRDADSRADQIAALDRLNQELGRALAGAPEALDAQSVVVRLQNRLAESDTQLALERRHYNQAVQDYNTALQLFPANIVAWLAGFEREQDYFRSNEATRQGDPPVRFTQEDTAVDQRSAAESSHPEQGGQ